MSDIQMLYARRSDFVNNARGHENNVEDCIAGMNLEVEIAREESRLETATEIYNLMIGEFEPYIDTGIAKEIAARFGVGVD